jgi:N-acetylated-alpha-linked acidic dipeptidase
VLKETVGAELHYHRKGRSSDQSFWGHGIPAMFGALSLRPGGGEDAAVAEIFGGESLGWWWHTTEDLIDKIDRDFLLRDAGVYAETLWQLCTDERLQFDPAAEADEIASAATHYQEASGGSLDLSSTSELARELSALIRIAGIDRLPAGRANDVISALCSTLIPVNYTKNGPFHHDLAVETKPVPGLMQAATLPTLDRSGDDWHFLHASLVRERNRVEHALRSAMRQVA